MDTKNPNGTTDPAVGPVAPPGTVCGIGRPFGMVQEGVDGTQPFEVPKTCPKCGVGDVDVRYDEVHNELSLSCGACGYRWSMEPKDRQARLLAMVQMVTAQEHAFHGMQSICQRIADARRAAAGGPLPGSPGTVPPEKTAHVFHCHPEVREHVRRATIFVRDLKEVHDRMGTGEKGKTGAKCEFEITQALHELELAESLL